MSRSLTNTLETAWARPPRLLALLLPLEWLFAAVTALRRVAFKRGWLASTHPGVPVLVVGNITVGGTGKTPTVIAITRGLQARGYRIGVVSRGYGGAAREPTRVDPEHASAALVGDEALLIARQTGAAVMVGRDRAAVAAALAPEVDLILSDDGLQHYALRRDMEIVTCDASAGFGNGHLLPVGPLRESPARLQSVDFVLQRGMAEAQLGSRFEPECFTQLHSGERRELGAPGFGPQVHALAAIARPARFFEELRALGFQPREHPRADHETVSSECFAALSDLPCVITAKDAIKCEGPDYARAHGDVWVLQMTLRLPDGFIDAILTRLAAKGVVLPTIAAPPCTAPQATAPQSTAPQTTTPQTTAPQSSAREY